MKFAGLDIDIGDTVRIIGLDHKSLQQFVLVGKVVDLLEQNRLIFVEENKFPKLCSEDSVRRIEIIKYGLNNLPLLINI